MPPSARPGWWSTWSTRPGPTSPARYPNVRFGPVVALVAAYNEEDNIGDVLKAMPTLVGDLEVSTLVVVDGASDGTAEVALDAGVFTCVLPVNLGQGAALRLGYGLAVGPRGPVRGHPRRRRSERPGRDGRHARAAARRHGRLRDRLPPARRRPDHRPVPAGRRAPLRRHHQRHRPTAADGLVQRLPGVPGRGAGRHRPPPGPGPVPDGRGGDHRLQPGLADHRAADHVAPPGLG